MTGAKRALNFGPTPMTKRRRTVPVSTARYRLSKPEMKAADFSITHTSVSESNTDLSQLSLGTGVNNRVGSRVKAWRIQGRFTASQPIRIELLMMNDASDSPTNTAITLYNYRRAVNLGTYIYDLQVSNSLVDFDHKLPIGLNMTYDGTASTDIVRNKVVARITTATATTVSGEFRLYFTDN